MVRALALQSTKTAVLLGPRFKSGVEPNIIIPFLGNYVICYAMGLRLVQKRKNNICYAIGRTARGLSRSIIYLI